MGQGKRLSQIKDSEDFTFIVFIASVFIVFITIVINIFNN
jgi:hypothetical protein